MHLSEAELAERQLSEVERLTHVEGSQVKVKKGEWAPISKFVKDWKRIIKRIPEYIAKAARGKERLRG